MARYRLKWVLGAVVLGLVAGGVIVHFGSRSEVATLPVEAGIGPQPQLPAPVNSFFPTVNVATAVGWSGGAPTAAPGLQVTAFASGLTHPRWLLVLPNGDVLVAETRAPKTEGGGFRKWIAGLIQSVAGAGGGSPDRITLLRDADGDGVAETRSTLLAGLASPFGMALVGDMLYVANADALVRVPYQAGATTIAATPEKVVDLPAGINHHWTKGLIASPDGSRLYVAVGSNSNVGENGMDVEENRAAILEVDPAAKTSRLFASGLRNPVGMAWEPTSGALWTAVNERDEIGSDLVPDYMTSVQDGGFYGWPYSYFGQNVDTRVEPQRPDLVARAIVPDYALGPHTASLGLTFGTGSALPAPFQEGAFVGQHGSWNRRPHSGYKVIFVPFAGGRPAGQPIDVLTGFRVDDKALGRPVGVAIDTRGALLVADDVGKVIWRVTGAATQ
ncbi:PQQ-dependent sugar dehydrogenase [Zavarzinia sp. CC-PAN008]|uniref:PQQ-dependent sugar dehydrogenase n=1 Tax=Zavarzinia sp. CC-PAN008 TaxID=3243332 RepID=UPI003F74273E